MERAQNYNRPAAASPPNTHKRLKKIIIMITIIGYVKGIQEPNGRVAHGENWNNLSKKINIVRLRLMVYNKYPRIHADTN